MTKLKSLLINQIPGAIFGILIAWGAYILTREKTEPVFIVDNIRSELISKENVQRQPIKIFKETGEEVKQDLVAVTFYLFNRGDASLTKRSHIVNDLKLQIGDSAAEIVGYKILKSSRTDINANLTLDTLAALPTLNINFSFLERDDGFTGQITYLGNPSAAVKILGTVLGTKDLNQYHLSLWETIRLNGERWIHLIVAAFALFMAIFIIYHYARENKNRLAKLEKLTTEVDKDFREIKTSVNDLTIDSLIKKSKSLSEKVFEKRRYEEPGSLLSLVISVVGMCVLAFLSYYLKRPTAQTQQDKTHSLIMSSIPEAIKPYNQ